MGVDLTQLFMVSLHCLWVYDYFLTFEDEVRYSRISRPERQVLTVTQIKYAWSGNKTWSEFASASFRILIVHTVSRQYLCCSLLYNITECFKFLWV